MQTHYSPVNSQTNNMISICRTIPRAMSCSAFSSRANNQLIKVELNDKTGVALVTLDRPPVNAINLELLKSFEEIIDDLERQKCRGMILTSSAKKVFCAGLQLTDIYKPDQDKLKDIWSTFQNVWIKLYGSSFPTAAAMNGHSIAGGCVLALSCDYRVMVPKSSIGLNETQLGIVLAPWIVASMENTISKRNTELALVQGTIFKTERALEIGLIDEIAVDKDEAVKKCEDFIARFAKIPPLAASLTKQQLRGKAIQDLKNNIQEDLENFVASINDASTQKVLEGYVQGLKTKKLE